MPVVKEIAYKHCALEVPPAGYDIVGENLIEAIKAVVGLEDLSSNYPNLEESLSRNRRCVYSS